MGMTLSGLPLGLGIEVVGLAQGPAQSGHLQTADWATLEQSAQEEGFPAHQLVVRPQDQDDPRLIKGIADWPALRTAFETCASQASNGQVFAELDLRAFANPTRMARIGEAAHDLLKRLQSTCPACAKPGYWITQRTGGLPCKACQRPTKTCSSQEWACVSCTHRHTERRTDRLFAEPQHCEHCNP